MRVYCSEVRGLDLEWPGGGVRVVFVILSADRFSLIGPGIFGGESVVIGGSGWDGAGWLGTAGRFGGIRGRSWR